MSRYSRTAFWIIVAAQLVFLLGFISVKETARQTGREVVLQTVPVDPRSLLQGDYAILDYEIARLPQHMDSADTGDTIYVLLSEGPEAWEAQWYQYNRPLDREVFIKGRVDRPGHLDFGIGTYFVPEGTGHIIERADDVKVVVKLDADGDAIISEVLVNGDPFDPDAE